MIDKSKIADAEQQAEIATLHRDLAMAQSQLRTLREKMETLQEDNETLEQRLMKKARREGESSILMDRLSNLRSDLRDMERERDQAITEMTGLQAKIEYLEGRNQGDWVEAEEHEALKTELAEARDKARKDLQALQDQLEEAEKHAAASPVRAVDKDNVLETEVLRQEHENLTLSLEDRESELNSLQRTCQLLEDELEDAHTEIDELRRRSEKQTADLQEARKELDRQNDDAVANMLAENMEKETLEETVPVLDIASAGSVSLGKKISFILLGVLLSVAVLEAISISTGKGELFSRLFNSAMPSTKSPVQSPVQSPVKSPDKSPSKPKPSKVDNTISSGEISR